jgi:hypothetical protein
MFPKQELPRYSAVLPSSGKTFSYRPFTVREQKALLLANESTNENEKLLNIKNIISQCTFGEIDAYNVPLFDIEYVILLIRTKSVGEIIDVQIACKQCGKTTDHAINIEEIKVKKNPNHTTDIKLTDDLGITMKYPTVEIENALKNAKDNTQLDFRLIAECVDSVHDKNQVYPAKNNIPMVEDFLDSLELKHFEKIVDFFYTMPQVAHDIEFECSHCKTANKIQLRGLADFLG